MNGINRYSGCNEGRLKSNSRGVAAMLADRAMNAVCASLSQSAQNKNNNIEMIPSHHNRQCDFPINTNVLPYSKSTENNCANTWNNSRFNVELYGQTNDINVNQSPPFAHKIKQCSVASTEFPSFNVPLVDRDVSRNTVFQHNENYNNGKNAKILPLVGNGNPNQNIQVTSDSSSTLDTGICYSNEFCDINVSQYNNYSYGTLFHSDEMSHNCFRNKSCPDTNDIINMEWVSHSNPIKCYEQLPFCNDTSQGMIQSRPSKNYFKQGYGLTCNDHIHKVYSTDRGSTLFSDIEDTTTRFSRQGTLDSKEQCSVVKKPKLMQVDEGVYESSIVIPSNIDSYGCKIEQLNKLNSCMIDKAEERGIQYDDLKTISETCGNFGRHDESGHFCQRCAISFDSNEVYACHMIGGEYSNKNVSTGEMHAQNSASDLSNMLNQTHTNAQPIGKVRPFHLQERFVNVPLDTFSPSFVQKLSAATTSEALAQSDGRDVGHNDQTSKEEDDGIGCRGEVTATNNANFQCAKKYRPAVHDHVGNSVSRQSNMSAFPDSVHSEIEITNSQSVPPLYVAQDLGGQLKPKGLISELRMLDDFREQGSTLQRDDPFCSSTNMKDAFDRYILIQSVNKDVDKMLKVKQEEVINESVHMSLRNHHLSVNDGLRKYMGVDREEEVYEPDLSTVDYSNKEYGSVEFNSAHRQGCREGLRKGEDSSSKQLSQLDNKSEYCHDHSQKDISALIPDRLHIGNEERYRKVLCFENRLFHYPNFNVSPHFTRKYILGEYERLGLPYDIARERLLFQEFRLGQLYRFIQSGMSLVMSQGKVLTLEHRRRRLGENIRHCLDHDKACIRVIVEEERTKLFDNYSQRGFSPLQARVRIIAGHDRMHLIREYERHGMSSVCARNAALAEEECLKSCDNSGLFEIEQYTASSCREAGLNRYLDRCIFQGFLDCGHSREDAENKSIALLRVHGVSTRQAITRVQAVSIDMSVERLDTHRAAQSARTVAKTACAADDTNVDSISEEDAKERLLQEYVKVGMTREQARQSLIKELMDTGVSEEEACRRFSDSEVLSNEFHPVPSSHTSSTSSTSSSDSSYSSDDEPYATDTDNEFGANIKGDKCKPSQSKINRNASLNKEVPNDSGNLSLEAVEHSVVRNTEHHSFVLRKDNHTIADIRVRNSDSIAVDCKKVGSGETRQVLPPRGTAPEQCDGATRDRYVNQSQSGHVKSRSSNPDLLILPDKSTLQKQTPRKKQKSYKADNLISGGNGEDAMLHISHALTSVLRKRPF